MGLSFFETMRGAMVDGAGATWPVEFEVRVDAVSLQGLLTTGMTNISGVVHAAPWAEEAALSGTLKIDPLVGRRLTYRFSFRDEEGAAYSFDGHKDLSLLRPVRSMSELASVLSRDGEEIARGQLRFDMAEAPALIASLRPTFTARHPALTRPDPDLDVGPPISTGEVDLVRALAWAIISQGKRVPAADEQTITLALEQLACFPPEALIAWRAALAALAAAVRLRTGRAATALPPGRLGDLLAGWIAAPGPLHPFGRALDFALMPIRVGHFSRPDYLDAIGFPTYAAPVADEQPRWRAQVVSAEDLPAHERIDCEVVIVGTGAGGAVVAAELAERGVAVCMVEEGPFRSRSDFRGSPVERMRSFYRGNGITFTAGSPPISIPLGVVVGGTTTINSGTCFRTPDAVLRTWVEELGLPDDLLAEAMDPHFARVEAELGVAPNEMRYLGGIAEVVARGAEAMGLTHRPLPRNAPDCDAQGTCIFGCPTDAKRSTNVSYVPRALRAGAMLFCGLPVTRLLRSGNRFCGVEARGTDAHGAPKVLHVHARAVVVSCGTLLTPGLLHANGIDARWLGRNLSVHPGMGMLARTEHELLPWDAVPQGYGVHGLASDGIMFEGAYVAPPFLAATMPLCGADLARWMDAHRHVGQYGFMVRDEGSGRILPGPPGRPSAAYKLSARSLRRLRKGSAALAEMLLRGGAVEVQTGFGHIPFVRTVQEARALEHAGLRAMDFNLLGAHPLGTCRLAGSPALGVLDSDHRVFGTDNLHVVDGSAVPSSLGVNPQITIMALATRVAGRLAELYG